MVGLAATYALGQAVQAIAHVAIYWLKLPWLVALGVQKLTELVPGVGWLKAKRYFRVLDVSDDRADIQNFQKSEVYKRARTKLLQCD